MRVFCPLCGLEAEVACSIAGFNVQLPDGFTVQCPEISARIRVTGRLAPFAECAILKQAATEKISRLVDAPAAL
jgi:hypothetical protein